MKENTPHEDPALLRELLARRMSRRDLLKFAGAGAGVIALAPVLAACGGSSSSSSTGGSPTKGSSTPIRFVFAPDPVWNWLEKQGIITQMEQESGFHIARTEVEDEFAFFAGGHADIVSTGSYETPVLEHETGVHTVTFGKYNYAKDIIVVAPDKPWTTIGDLPKGSKVGVEDFGGSSLIWIAIAKDQYGRTLSKDPGDLQMVVTDFSVAPDLVVKGQLQAGVTSYQNCGTYLRENKVKGLWDAMSAAQVYEKFIQPGHLGVMSNNFVCLKDYYDAHPKEIAFFLSVWQRGEVEWFAHMDEIVKGDPQDFGWKTTADYNWIIDWLNNHFNEFAKSVYNDATWINGEQGVTKLLRDAGQIPASQPDPYFVGIDPKTGTQTVSIPTGA
jgi:ABC-type nitrate/sulfonate/bicarbonate transport system substrate-binding protein